MADFDIAFKKTMGFEDGYVNDKDDDGRETKYGISKKQYKSLNIRELTLNEVKNIYKRDYWNKIKGNNIRSQDVANNLFDCAVHCGVPIASRLLQKVLGVKQDGIIGPITLGSLNKSEPDVVVSKFKNERVKYYIDICKRKKSQRKFFFGWVTRAMEV